jgi:ADP-heptose:LPS heptosyltransferase
LFAVENVTFFSLQKGDAATELQSVPPNTIIDLGQYFDDFVDTAAAIQEMDLVISVDTSVAHLAGALGRPVWTLLPFVPDWRWLLNREDSPWYPTMRLFRQPALGDWVSVIKRVSEELKILVGAE